MWERVLVAALVAFVVFKVTLITYRRRKYPEPHEDWANVNLDDLHFPEGFHWGTATAAHQVEGHQANNWTVHEAAKGLEASGAACDHWNRWKDDFQLLSDLGMTSYRFSIEWSRLEPTEGAWDEAALAVYSEMVDDLVGRGIRPVVTLHHFTHPDWWEAKGGFADRSNVPAFVAYCERVVDALADRVKTWVTVNEPTVFSTMGYTLGMFPPGRRSIPTTLRVMRNLLFAHGTVYMALKPKHPELQFGVAKNVTLFDPRTAGAPSIGRWPVSWSGCGTGLAERHSEREDVLQRRPEAKASWILSASTTTRTCWSVPLGLPAQDEIPQRRQEVATEFGYPMYAEGLARALDFLKPLGVPIEITENGVADAEDTLRAEHLRRHLWVLSNALRDGHDVRSYHHWSLLDNFEWAEGYSMRFGLHHVDFETQERTLRPSGEAYRQIVQQH